MRQIEFERHHDYGCEVPPCSRRDLVEVAHAVHKRLGYEGSGPFPIMQLVEHVFPFLYEDYEFEVVGEGEMGDEFGKTWPDEHRICIREDVYEAAVRGVGFARMVVAHEASHLIKHEGVPLMMASREATASMPAYRSSEWQANALAGSLLMPACKIVGMTAEEIVEVYQVSLSAAEIHLSAMKKEVGRWLFPRL